MAIRTPILIIGYERSGTTLLRRLVSMHPSLKHDIVHERGKTLMASKTADSAVKRLTGSSKQAGVKTGGTFSLASGQKIPYDSYGVAHGAMNKFNEFFPRHMVLHIVRDPIQVVSSQVRTFNRNPDASVTRYFNSVPKISKHLRKKSNAMEISYADLVGNAISTMRSVYRWMGEAVDDDLIKRIVSTKPPWKFGKKHMVGLRYFDDIRPGRSEIKLDKSILEKIQNLKERYGIR